MPEELTDEELEAGLRDRSAPAWADLWAAATRLAADDAQAAWSDDPTQLPYAIYSDTVMRILGLWSELGLVQQFDWPHWDGVKRYRAGADLETAPVADAIRMATAIVRGDRFSEGTIEASLQDGTFQAVLRRLRRWYEAG